MQETISLSKTEYKPAVFSGGPRVIFEIMWVIVVVISVGLFILGWPLRLQELLSPSAEIMSGIDQAGLNPTIWAIGMLGTETVLMLTCSVLGILLYFQRRKEVVIFVTSLLLILFGTGILNVLDALIAGFPQLEYLVRFLKAGLWSLLLLFFYVFPNGKFEQSWSRWSYAGWLVFTWTWFFFPNSAHDPTRMEVFNHLGVFLAYFLWLGSGVVLLFRRSQKSATYEERQQTKWLIFAIASAVLITFLEEIPSTVNNALLNHATPGGIKYALASTLIFTLGVMLVPGGIAFSIYRKRLWKIDYILNRSLVHGVMTFLIIFGVLMVFAIGSRLIIFLFGDQNLAYPWMADAILIILVYKPVKRWVQRVVDRRIFGIQVSYQKPGKRALKNFGLETDWSEKVVGRYQIGRLLNCGRGGRVYFGTEINSMKPVAVKFLHQSLAENPKERNAFAEEAVKLGLLDHPNIIKFLEYGEANQTTCYLVMEYISDHTLGDLLKKKAFSLEETKFILSHLASALDYAHGRKVIHLDLKPGNILMKPDSTNPYGYLPVLTDFGISQIQGQKSNLPMPPLTGSFDYISPEQISNSQKLDERADIYSLGVLAFQMLTGQMPFTSKHPAALLLAHINQPAPNPLEINPALDAKTSFAILKALSKDPAQRFKNATLFSEHLA